MALCPAARTSATAKIEQIQRMSAMWAATAASQRFVESPVWAVRALSKWGRDNWPDEAVEHIKKVISEEPEADVQKRLEEVLVDREVD